ncbi:MAG TPA: hypothetical protein ENH87_08320 [Pricia antarctica]|uniref:Uncharacterized protein n=2 Tax=root TaxID=1 RepID=A0A831VMP9_9FLAO|nr:hypothetical protein [Pricia antarctica]
MENYCLDIGKLVTGTGLVFDILGVIILVGIEITSHKIEYLKDNPFVTNKDNQIDLSAPQRNRVSDMLAGKPIELTESEHLYLYHNGASNYKNSKCGFVLLVTGFGLQIIALFIDYCISI